MSANTSCLAEEGGRKDNTPTLWNLHENLSRLVLRRHETEASIRVLRIPGDLPLPERTW